MKNAIYLFLCIILLASCTKETNIINNDVHILNKNEAKALKDFFINLPIHIRYKDEQNRFVDFDVRTGEYCYTKSWNFASPSTSPYVFVDSLTGTTIYMPNTNNWFNNSSQTYAVTAGNTTLNVNTVCLAASFNQSLFPFQVGTNGISFVMGIDGSPGLIGGIALYLVYESPASGSYNVIDWQNYTGNNVSNEGIAVLFSYGSQQFDYYVSESGTLNVSNGDITFNGDYYQISGNYTSINPGTQYNIVSGSGTMGCQ
jgi:hypothetical protein